MRVVCSSHSSQDDGSAPRQRWELAAAESGGCAKLGWAATHYDLTRFVLASVVGRDRPERREAVLGATVALLLHMSSTRLAGSSAGPGEDGFVGKQRHGRAP